MSEKQAKILTEVDEVYAFIGPFGRSQVLYLLGLSFLNLVAAFNFLGGVFMLLSPEWVCVGGESLTCNSTMKLCDLERGQWEWAGNKSSRTMVSHFGLECEDGLAALSSSLFFIPGTVIGLVISGYLSDKFGRKKVTLGAAISTVLTSVAQALAPSYTFFLVARTISGATCIGFQAVHMTYMTEFFPSTKRPLCNFIGLIFKVLGLITLAGVYELFPVWNSIHIANTIMLVVGCWVVFIPESPYWLLANQGPEAAALVLDKMAMLNGRASILGQINLVLPEKKMEEEGVATKQTDYMICLAVPTRSERTVKTGFGNAIRFLVVTLALFYQWFLVSLMFYGFYYALDGISGSVTVNFLIMAVLEVPTGVVTAWSMGRFGRWNTLFLNLALILICSAVSLLKVELGATGWDLKRVALIVGSKWGTAAVFMIIYLYTNEVMPTSIRSSGQNLCSIFARIGAFVAPYVVKAANNTNDYLLNSLFMGLCLVGLGTMWWLPETKDRNLKSTLE
eukprot:sb/3463989/